MQERSASNGFTETFLHGECHLLAVALHRLSGLPIMACVETDFEGEDETVLIHAFVVEGDDAIDARGRVPLKGVLDGFDYWDEEFVEMTEAEVLKIGGAISPDGIDAAPGFRNAMAFAENLLERTRFLVRPSASPS